MNAIAEKFHRILHVEDDDDYVFLFKDSIEELLDAVQLKTAGDGFEALTLLEKSVEDPSSGPPDLILLDINMPRMNGFDFLRKMKENPRLAGIPVVMLTASNREEDRRAAAALGAVDYICKVSSLSEIVAAIQKYLKEGN